MERDLLVLPEELVERAERVQRRVDQLEVLYTSRVPELRLRRQHQILYGTIRTNISE